MTKKIVLTAFVALFAASMAIAQTDPQPRPGAGTPTPQKIERIDNKPKTAKDAGKIENAEEKSNGAAYSGKGKGGDKDKVQKIENGKGKAKGKGHAHGKGKSKGKSKDKTKRYEGPDAKPGTTDKEAQEAPQHGDQNPDEAANKKGDVNKKKEPKPAQPAPAERKPGQRPGTAKEKENDH